MLYSVTVIKFCTQITNQQCDFFFALINVINFHAPRVYSFSSCFNNIVMVFVEC